jgi:hypothetical protein
MAVLKEERRGTVRDKEPLLGIDMFSERKDRGAVGLTNNGHCAG